jgi:hypothetical protein
MGGTESQKANGKRQKAEVKPRCSWDDFGECIRFAFSLLTFDLFFVFVTPHPTRDGWRKRRRGPPSPLGRGPYFHTSHADLSLPRSLTREDISSALN